MNSTRHLNGVLPGSETVALALHLVNAGFANGDLSDTYKMTGVIQQMLDHHRADATASRLISTASTSAGSLPICATCSYASIRASSSTRNPQPIIASIRQSYPKAMQCAQTIGTVASLRLGSNLTEDEVAYLGVARRTGRRGCT